LQEVLAPGWSQKKLELAVRSHCDLEMWGQHNIAETDALAVPIRSARVLATRGCGKPGTFDSGFTKGMKGI
jgi:hypothetical protein